MKNRIIYLAAGNSIRFGGNKLLHEINGRPMYRHTFDILLDIIQNNTEYSLTVVTQYQEIFDYVNSLNISRVRVLFNPDSRLGMSFSIKAGINSLPKENAYDTFIVADQPGLTYETLTGLMQETILSGKKTGCIRYDGISRNPVIFHSSLEAEFEQLKGDEGGKKILKRYTDDCYYYDITDVVEITDIDRLP